MHFPFLSLRTNWRTRQLLLIWNTHRARCLKNTEKISFNIASEASYVYILSGQNLILKNAKNGQFGELLKTLSLRSNSVTRQVNFNRTKIGRKCQKFKNSNATFWVIFKQCDRVWKSLNVSFYKKKMVRWRYWKFFFSKFVRLKYVLVWETTFKGL